MKLKDARKLAKKGIVLFGTKEKKFPKGGIYWKTESYEKAKFTDITKGNLEKLADLYGFKWGPVVIYKVEQVYFDIPVGMLPPKPINGKGYIVYGLLGNKPTTYIRKETRHPTSGQTLLYYGGGVSIQATTLLDFEKTSQFSTGQKRANQFLDFVKYTKSLNPIPLKLQRIIFEII